MRSIRTDLAMEARELLAGEIPGVSMERCDEDGVEVTRVGVLDDRGVKAIGKPVGAYVTLETSELWQRDSERLVPVAEAIAREITALLPPLNPDDVVLVVGLGNRRVTADALGPLALESVLVARQLTLTGIASQLRPVCAFAPGVMGVTGVESLEAVSGLCSTVKPALVIAIDALAARSTARIISTVQIADTGIAPGSGIGNRRGGLNRETLGIPVLAVGVPMVVYAETIAWDAVDELRRALSREGGAGVLGAFSDEDMETLVREISRQAIGDLVVSPKEVDEAVRNVAAVVGLALSIALQPGLTPQDILMMA